MTKTLTTMMFMFMLMIAMIAMMAMSTCGYYFRFKGEHIKMTEDGWITEAALSLHEKADDDADLYAFPVNTLL